MSYPVFLDLEGKNCLVIGGGQVAWRKTRSLLKAKAKVTVVSPTLRPELQELAAQNKINYQAEAYQPSCLAGRFLVISAVDQAEAAQQIAQDCHERNLLLNSALLPETGNFQVPAVCERGALQIAVSTGGKSPFLARIIKEQLEAEFGSEYEDLLQFLEELRADLWQKIPDTKQRQKLWPQIFNQEVIELIKQGQIKKAKERMVNADCYGRSQP